MRPKAWNLIRKSRYSRKAWNLKRKSHKDQKAWNLRRTSHKGRKAWNIIRRTSHKIINVRHKPHKFLQWAMEVHPISRILHPPIEPSKQYSMSSRPVKAFSNIHIDSLDCIVVTFATSHLLRSPLKAEALQNTVARKEGRLHSQSTRKKTGQKNPDYITPPTRTPDWTSLNRNANKHEISYGNLVAAQKHEISWAHYEAKSMNSHENLRRKICSKNMKSH